MSLEKNTYTTSSYIAVNSHEVLKYLGDLKNLDEWTLNSRMQERVDDDTWIGTASGFHRRLSYHVKRYQRSPFFGIEWHCGLENEPSKLVYPVLVFEPTFFSPSSQENGSYFHWIASSNPSGRDPVYMQGVKLAHDSETRALKAVLERRHGHRKPVPGELRLESETLFVDCPLGIARNYLEDLKNIGEWNHLLRPTSEISSTRGEFLDEYLNPVTIQHETYSFGGGFVVDHRTIYSESDWTQASPFYVIPCAHAFNQPDAQGVLLHRVVAWPTSQIAQNGKQDLEQFAAEGMNLKRKMEHKAGNLHSFSLGMSYLPKESDASMKRK